MNCYTTFFEMVDSICGDSAPTCKPYDHHEAEFAYQPGYFDSFDGILDECDPVVKALVIDAPARVVTNAPQIDMARSVPPPIEPTIGHASPASADASPSTSARASLPEETWSSLVSPLFTPTSEPVDLPCVQESVQPETSFGLSNGHEEECTTAIKPVDTAQVPTAPVPATSSGSFPVCASDVDVLSLAGPPASSFQSAPEFPSPGTSDATSSSPSSFELSPIPGSKLANITRKRKRGLVADDDYQPATVPDAFPCCAVQDQSSSQSGSAVEADANKYATSVPPSLLDEIAAAAVAATIRASPGVNVFASAKRARKSSKASKKPPPRQETSFGSPAGPYMPNAQWQGVGMPPSSFAIPPSQAYGPANIASYASSSGPALYGPNNTNTKRRRAAGPSFTGRPLVHQDAAATYPTAGHFQPQALEVAPSFMNAGSSNCGIVTPEIQQTSGLGFIQPPTSNWDLPPIADTWSGACQNWADALPCGPLQQDIADVQIMQQMSYGNGDPFSFQIFSEQEQQPPLAQAQAHVPETHDSGKRRGPKKRSNKQLEFSSDNVGVRETFTCQIAGCNQPISILPTGAWSVKRVLQEHGHLAEYPTSPDDTITCQWVAGGRGDGRRCLQRTKWANYTRHFSGHLGVLVRQCEFCASVQARPSNLARHYRTCKAYQRQDYETRRAAWMKLNTRQGFDEFELSMGRTPGPQ